MDGRNLSDSFPIRQFQAGRSPELSLVARHKDQIEGEGLGGDQHVVGADHLASLFELPTQARGAIMPRRPWQTAINISPVGL